MRNVNEEQLFLAQRKAFLLHFQGEKNLIKGNADIVECRKFLTKNYIQLFQIDIVYCISIIHKENLNIIRLIAGQK